MGRITRRTLIPLGLVVTLVTGVVSLAWWARGLDKDVSRHEDRLIELENHQEKYQESVTAIFTHVAVIEQELRDIKHAQEDMTAELAPSGSAFVSGSNPSRQVRDN